ncbi:MAG TPA: YggT family protein [Pyrinomonadaceae bacterium]|jgi:YggT family protein|nr:YggT family protein [Pyrinomonadaceae bacterium]
MKILIQVHWFIYQAVIVVILAVVGLVVLRLIANKVNPNPFGWTSRTIRRLTDPLIAPVRRALFGFGVDPKYAPFVTILLTILLGWFAIQLVTSLANTIAGILLSLGARGGPAPLIGYILYGLLSFYSLLIFIRIIFSWVMVSHSNRLMRLLVNATEPLLGPLRRFVPLVGTFDISPLVAFLVIWLFQAAVAGTLLRGWPIFFLG